MPRIDELPPRERWRVRILWALFYLVFLLLAAQTVHVSAFPDPRIANQAAKQYWAQVPVSTSRGDILDRNGIPLAISVPATSFFIDPVTWSAANASVLAQYLGKETGERFGRPLKGRFYWVARKVSRETAVPLAAKEVPGLYTLKERERVYPHGALASHVLGFCDIDDNGLAGIEMAWNSVLFSPPQSKLLVRDARGRMIDMIASNAGTVRKSAGSIKLTIDARFQQVLEWRIREGAVKFHAKWGAAVCLNPQNGEILAMASYPSVNPNDRANLTQQEALRNNVVGRVYEPGSTLKPIIMGIAREEALASTGEQFFCSGRIQIADAVIRDVSAHGQEMLQDLLINSCNTGMAQIGRRFHVHRAYGMLRQFGFGEKTHIEIAGEEEGLLRPPEQWLGTVPSNIAIGQGIAVTPLQLALGIGAVANGGYLLKPYIVAEVKDGYGKVIHQGRRRVRAEVLSPAVSEWLRKTMRVGVERGTGKAANTPLTTVAGKTGTAQIAAGGEYAKGKYVGSFVGFWPSDNPKYVLLIVLGEPQGASYYGGEIAAPLFKAAVTDLIQITAEGEEAKERTEL